MKEPTVVLTVRINERLRQRLAARARNRFGSRPNTVGVVTAALTMYLDKLDADEKAERKGVRRG